MTCMNAVNKVPLEERRLDPNRGAAWGYERTSAWRVSMTDPDATPM